VLVLDRNFKYGFILTLDVRKQVGSIGQISHECLDRAADLSFVISNLSLFSFLTSPTHHSVLSHQNNTLSTDRHTDFVHLLRADIVDIDQEDGLVVGEQALELVKVGSFVSRPGRHCEQCSVFKGTGLVVFVWFCWLGGCCRLFFDIVRSEFMIERRNDVPRSRHSSWIHRLFTEIAAFSERELRFGDGHAG